MAFVAIAALSGCSQNEEFVFDNGQSSYDKNAVTFGTYLGQSPKTRASVTTIDVMKGNTYPGFGVFAYNTGADNFADASSTATPDFMRNEQVKWDGTASAWTYANVKRWPNEEKVSFFAYAPHTKTPDAENITALPTQTTAGDPVIAFTVAKNVGDQIDLLYAEAKTNQTKETNGGKVQFQFNHALSRIGFKAKLEGEAGSKGRVTINTITFKSSALNPSGKFNLHTGEWTEKDPGSKMEYTFTSDNFEAGSNVLALSDAETTSDPVLLTGDGNYLMVIPTDSKASVEITVNYSETLENGTSRNVTLTTPFEFAFEQGKAYSLVLSIGLTPKSEIPTDVSFTADVKDWNNLNPDGSDNDVPIDYNVATLTMYAINPDLTYKYARFSSDNSFLRIIKVPCEADEVEYEMPEDLFNLEARVYVDEIESSFGDWYSLGEGELQSGGWTKKKMPITNQEPSPDDIVATYSDKKIILTKSENTTLYPYIYAEGTN